MSDQELIEALRFKGEQRARHLWKEAEEEVERLHEEMEARLRIAREEVTRTLGHFEDRKVSERLQQAQEKSREIVLDAEHALTRRCYRLAADMIKSLGSENREMLLQRLSEELPEASWETICVNPQDREAADRLFPDARVETDDSISAGFDIATADRQVAINNTMEMRLQRSWPFLLPDLMRHIREILNVHESAEKQNI